MNEGKKPEKVEESRICLAPEFQAVAKTGSGTQALKAGACWELDVLTLTLSIALCVAFQVTMTQFKELGRPWNGSSWLAKDQVAWRRFSGTLCSSWGDET